MRKLAALLLISTACHRADDYVMHARNYLDCPASQGELRFEDLGFHRGDSRRDTHDWAKFRVTGCSRVTWCGPQGEAQVCRDPQDLEIAKEQLAVESGCSTEAIQQVQWVNLTRQMTYRLSACGAQYACVVPMEKVSLRDRDDEAGNWAPGGEGGALSCKAVQSTRPAPRGSDEGEAPAGLPPPLPPRT